MPQPFKVMMPGMSPQGPSQGMPQPPMQQEEPNEAGPEGAEQDSAIDEDDVGLPKLDPALAGYLPPEKGPFRCGGCVYFESEGHCAIVSGDIKADGCCNLFTPGANPNQEESPEADDQGAMMPQAAPDANATMAMRGPQQ